MSETNKSPQEEFQAALDLESAFVGGAIRALRNRAEAKRKAAAVRIVPIECVGGCVIVVASEAREALNIARDLDAIADDLAVAS